MTGRQWIVKIMRYRPAAGVDGVMKLLAAARYSWIPEQRCTAEGELWARRGRLYYSLQAFVEPGEKSDVFALDDAFLPELGRVLRALHSVTVPPHVSRQLPGEFAHEQKWERQLCRLMKPSWYSRRSGERRRLAVQYAPQMQALLRAQQQWREQQRKTRRPPVLVHADIHPFNLLRPTSDRLVIIDWDTARMGHREEDLMYFDDRQLRLISEGYGEDVTARRDAVLYYRRHLRIRELVHFGTRELRRGVVRRQGMQEFATVLRERLADSDELIS